MFLIPHPREHRVEKMVSMADCFTLVNSIISFYSNNFYFKIVSVFANFPKTLSSITLKQVKCTLYMYLNILLITYARLLQLQIHESQFKVQYILMRFCAV